MKAAAAKDELYMGMLSQLNNDVSLNTKEMVMVKSFIRQHDVEHKHFSAAQLSVVANIFFKHVG